MASTIAEAVEEARENGVFEVPVGASLSDSLPIELREVRHLREIDVSGSGLMSLPRWLPELENLRILNISRCSRSVFDWDIIKRCGEIRDLGLSSLGINRLPNGLGDLTRLERVSLSHNTITEFPTHFASEHLRFLDVGGNLIEDIPRFDAPALEVLIAWGHGFPDPPRSLMEFTSLQVLDLSSDGSSSVSESATGEYSPMHELSGRIVGAPSRFKGQYSVTIPEWFGSSFPHLRQLYLGGIGLESLPDSLSELSQLEGLFLAFNRLRTVHLRQPALSNLRLIDLTENLISIPPDWIDLAPSLAYLFLAGNPIGIPPEILSSPDDPQRIVDYVDDIRTDGRPLNEAKVVMVGEGGVGKTSLVNRLVEDEFSEDEDKTEGIKRTRWRIPETEVVANIWDFGGQEIMHATHQFFLSARSLYILVLDARQGDAQNRIDYWMRIIDTYSNSSPVMIVGNKVDQNPLDIDTRGWQLKYPQLRAILSTSCASEVGLDRLLEEIQGAVKDLSHIRDRLPLAYFDVKNAIELSRENYLTYAHFQQLCTQSGIDARVGQESLARFLHDLGTILCFRDDPRLADTNILNPDWVTGGVYRILNSVKAHHQRGLLARSDMSEILDSPDYPLERQSFIVDMMKRFELCYESEEILFVPDLLTKVEPDTGDWSGALQLVVRYPVLPPSILSRLIVRMNSLISQGTVWRTGVVLRIDDNRALIKADMDEQTITVSVTGGRRDRRALLTTIRTELRNVEATIPGLEREERVPVPGEKSLWVPYAHLVSLEAAGRSTVIPQGSVVEFPVRDLLDGVEEAGSRFSADAMVGVANSSEARSRVTADKTPTPSTSPSARPWTFAQSLSFGGFLIAAVIATLAAFAIGTSFLGPQAGAAIAGAVIFIVAVALVIMRVSGHLSEDVFAEALGKTLALLKSGEGAKDSNTKSNSDGDGGTQQ